MVAKKKMVAIQVQLDHLSHILKVLIASKDRREITEQTAKATLLNGKYIIALRWLIRMKFLPGLVSFSRRFLGKFRGI